MSDPITNGPVVTIDAEATITAIFAEDPQQNAYVVHGSLLLELMLAKAILDGRHLNVITPDGVAKWPAG